MTDIEIARRIQADGIHIMIYLASHFDANTPLPAHYRPAPIQVSFHNGGSTAMEAMDYWLTDDVLHPPESPERFTETLLHLPHFYSYPEPENVPPVAPLPCLKRGYPTLASFNNPAKINRPLVALWGQILSALPEARLQLKYRRFWQDTALQKRVKGWFEAEGVNPSRVEMLIVDDTFQEHMGRYGGVDLAPTTFQALWMGVPVISRLGDRFIQRMGGSIVVHAGLEDLAVSTPEAYVAQAVSLARDRTRLQALRAGLRNQVAGSALCDGPGYARRVETVLAGVWNAQPKAQ